MIVLEMGGSSNLCAYLQEGEQVVVMGPTGSPTEIPENEIVARRRRIGQRRVIFHRESAEAKGQ